MLQIAKVGSSIVRPDLPAAAGRFRPPHPAMPRPGAVEFARAIGQRYAAGPANQPRLSLVFRQARIGVGANHVYQRLQLYLAPHFTVSPAAPPPAQRPALKLERVTETYLFRQPLIRILRAQVQTETLVERLATREVRIESVASGGRGTAAANAGAPALSQAAPQAGREVIQPSAPPVPRVVRQASIVPAAQSAASGSTEPRSSQAEAKWWPARPPAVESPSPALSAVELNRVTDHVVQAIDRRLSAHRERLGRA